MKDNGIIMCDNCIEIMDKTPCPICGYDKENYEVPIGVLPVGSVLQERYHIGKVLGKGGFGVTYKAYDMKEHRKVAIKEYYPNGMAHRDTGSTQVTVSSKDMTEDFSKGAEKFFEEAKTISRFNGNPNIVGVYDFFYENGTAYFIMEYLDGMDLKHYIKLCGGRLTQENVLHIAQVVSDALVITHSLNVLHRDISPDNIYITSDGNIKLIDFGAARQVASQQSKSLSVILKQGFAPLEQYQRKGKQGAWTDIYALGATLYYALTGLVPDDATERIDESDIGKAEDYNVDTELWAIIDKCMAVKISDRYGKMTEFKDDLNDLKMKSEAPLFYKNDKKEKDENISSYTPKEADRKETTNLSKETDVKVTTATELLPDINIVETADDGMTGEQEEVKIVDNVTLAMSEEASAKEEEFATVAMSEDAYSDEEEFATVAMSEDEIQKQSERKENQNAVKSKFESESAAANKTPVQKEASVSKKKFDRFGDEIIEEPVVDKKPKNKKNLFIIGGCVAACVLLVVLGLISGHHKTYTWDEYIEKPQKVRVGDSIIMGSYDCRDEDGKSLSGGNMDLKWDVIEKDDDSLLLFSSYLIDQHMYHTGNSDSTLSWGDSLMCKYLNTSFYYDTFTTEEKQYIKTSDIDGTECKVFLLASSEITSGYRSATFANGDEATYPTVYWTRGATSSLSEKNFIRPAMWISTSNSEEVIEQKMQSTTNGDEAKPEGETTEKPSQPVQNDSAVMNPPSADGRKDISIYVWKSDLEDQCKYVLSKMDPALAKHIKIINVDVGGLEQVYIDAIEDGYTGNSDYPSIIFSDIDCTKKLASDNRVMAITDAGINNKMYANAYEYTKEVGNIDGTLKAVSWQATPGCLIYRADIADQVLGTSNPDEVAAKISDWDGFFAVAEQMKNAGYKMVSGTDEIKYACLNQRKSPWLSNNELVLGEEVNTYFDNVKRLNDGDYTNHENTWSLEWYNSMADGNVFCYFGTTWFISLMDQSWCGSEAGNYGKWRICAPPQNYNWGGTFLMIGKDSPDVELAAYFVYMMCCDEDVLYGLVADSNCKSPETFVNNSKVIERLIAEGFGEIGVLERQNIYTVLSPNVMNTSTHSSEIDLEVLNAVNAAWNKYLNGELSSTDECVDYVKQNVRP